MTKKFNAVIVKEDNWYVVHCVELDVVSQGKTIEEAEKNKVIFYKSQKLK